KKAVVVDADIAGAFDNLTHHSLLKALGRFPARALIKQWLKAGCMEEAPFISTETGTPQGGVLSRLLLNVALHGMEDLLEIQYKKKGTSPSGRFIVRYADDFVISCESQADAQQVIHLLTGWLAQRGLTLSPEKTTIRHIREGFDFLGFNIRQYPAPQTT